MTKLWCDLTTVQEKIDFIKSGKAWETGIIAKALEKDIVSLYKLLVKKLNEHKRKKR